MTATLDSHRDGILVRFADDARGLRRKALFHQLLQALIELPPAGTEGSPLESFSNHISSRSASAEDRQHEMFITEKPESFSR